MQQLRRIVRLRHHQIYSPVSIVIRHGAAALLTVNLDARLLAFHRAQSTFPIAQQYESPTRVAPQRLRLCRKKVLRHKHIVVPVTVEVRHVHSKRRSHLRLDRQRHGFKFISPIQKQHVSQLARFQHRCGFQFISVNLLKVSIAERLERRRVAANVGNRRCAGGQVAFRHELVCDRIDMRFDDLHPVHLVEVAVENLQRSLRIILLLVLAVLSPIRRNKVQPPVAVEIPHRHSVPPTRELVQSPRRRGIGEAARCVDQNLNRAPFASDNQVLAAVAIQIGKHSRADHA